jgi:hypothetical protein
MAITKSKGEPRAYACPRCCKVVKWQYKDSHTEAKCVLERAVLLVKNSGLALLDEGWVHRLFGAAGYVPGRAPTVLHPQQPLVLYFQTWVPGWMLWPITHTRKAKFPARSWLTHQALHDPVVFTRVQVTRQLLGEEGDLSDYATELFKQAPRSEQDRFKSLVHVKPGYLLAEPTTPELMLSRAQLSIARVLQEEACRIAALPS